MAFHPFEVNVPHLAYTILGGFVVVFGLFSLLIKERLYIGEAVIATVVGIAFGPHGANLFSPQTWGAHATNEITLEVTRVVIAIGVFAVGVELPKAYMKRHWKSIAFLLAPVMIFGWMISGLLIWGLFPKLNFLTSLVIAACVTPTDPILAQAVVGGKFADKHVPAHIRHLLSAESGCNDGAAFPFLYLALYLVLDASDKHAIGEWFYITCYEVALGTTIGSCLGFSVRKVMKFCERKNLIDRQSFVAQYVSMAVLTIGITTLLGSDDLLAAFAAGTAFAWDGFFNKATEDSMFSNVIDLLFNCACFIYIGAIIPFDDFSDAELGISVWRLFVLAICILLVRRLPIIMALYRWIPDIKTPREAAFVGWFGPMGVGAIFIATLARLHLPEEIDYPSDDQVDILAGAIQPIVAFLVLTSVLCHGLSIPFFSLGRRVHSISHTWSRTSIDLRNEPAWATHARRIDRGAQIRINRDDDVEGHTDHKEVADDGTTDRGGGLTQMDIEREKQSSVGSSQTQGESSSSRRLFVRGGGEKSDVDAMERGEYRPNGENGNGDIALQPMNEREVYCKCDAGDLVDERTTPPLAEYREGPHLVIERKRSPTQEVEVEVIRNYFDKEAPTEMETFTHPHPLKHKEVDLIAAHIHDSLAHAVSAVKEHGEHKIDKIGLGMMGPEEIKEDEEEELEKQQDNKRREAGLAEGRPDNGQYDSPDATEDHAETSASGAAAASQRSDSHPPRRSSKGSAKPSTIFIHSRPNARRRDSLRRKGVAGTTARDRSKSPREPQPLEDPNEEEEVAEESDDEAHTPDSSRLAPPGLRGRSSASSDVTGTDVTPVRSSSPVRPAPAIRFATETAQSSDTVPSGMKAYGRSPSGGNSGLAMYRSSSVQSDTSQRSEKESSRRKFRLPGRK